ncbi:MAG: pyridoxamine 5'-phosphate oxidase family protein [Planctomycetota bacterium]|nr:pyridoxamine 5'-phosphate oxidase family protein [Planctomycetota bacterium]
MSEHEEIRKKEREVSDEGLLFSVLDKALYGVLAMAESGKPYCVPMSFVRIGRSLYFHSALVGMKNDTIDASPRVAFSVVDHAKYLEGATSCT